MGCGCGKKAQRATDRRSPPPRDNQGDASGAVIAAARAGGEWRLTTAGGTVYDFPSLAEARAGQRVYGGTVGQHR